MDKEWKVDEDGRKYKLISKEDIIAELPSVYKDYPAVFAYIDWLCRKVTFYQNTEILLYCSIAVNVLSILAYCYMIHER